MTERLKFMGRMEERRMEAKRLELKIKGLLEAIRDHLDPTMKIEDLKAEIAAAQAFELAESHGAYKAILEEIAQIHKILGR